MKQNNIIKLVLLLVLYSVFANAKINWAPIMMGDITTFAPYAKTNTLQTLKDVYKPNDLVSVKVDAALSGHEDWVGVYHKNASSAWKNVVAWNWVSNGTTALSTVKKTMPVGEYEARLFFHNKYEKKASYPFTVAVSNFQTTKATYAPNETVSVIVNVPLSGTKDWVGIFKKNTSSTRANLIAWNYITKKGRFDISKKLISIMPAGEYEARLFFKDSYNVEQTFGFRVGDGNKKYPNTIKLKDVPKSTYNMSKPAKGKTVVDNVLGTKITQIEKTKDKDNYNYNAWYPKVQSWNKNMKYLRIGYRIYDAHTYKETDITKGKNDDEAYTKLCGGVYGYSRWSYTNPNKFFIMNNSTSASYTPRFVIGTIDEDNNVHCEKRDIFKDFEWVYMTLEEGNIDNNDQYVVMIGKKKDDIENVYVMLYDIKNNQRIWTKQFDLDDQWYKRWNKEHTKFEWIPYRLDWITVTPSGQRIVAHFAPQDDTIDELMGTYVYGMNLNNRKQLKYKNDNGGTKNAIPLHGDIGYDVDGHEVFVQYMLGVGIYMYNLENPNNLGTAVIKSSYLGRGHISCRNSRRPGWCYVSPYDRYKYGYVFAVKLKAIEDAKSDNEKENVQLFSRTFRTNPKYYETYGSSSPDGTKMIFNTEDGGTFVAEVK